MNIADFLQNEGNKRGISFEVLPPLKGNGTAALFRTIDSLKDYAPRFINITTHHSEYVYKELENGLLSRWASAISWYFAVIRLRMIECSLLPKMVMRMQPTF